MKTTYFWALVMGWGGLLGEAIAPISWASSSPVALLGFTTQAASQDNDDRRAVEATSLLGETLYRPKFDPARFDELHRQLAEAERNADGPNPSVDELIWVGRRLAYLGRYRDAIDTFSKAIDRHPEEPALYRHRGHRWITVREFDRAINDLERAAELIEGHDDIVEPDGQPNAANIPTSTLQTNIFYHLGLAKFLIGDFHDALEAYEQCLARANNDDMKVATLDWMYMTLRRLDRNDEANQLIASVDENLELLENHVYHKRLLMYRGLIKPDELLNDGESSADDVAYATYGFGVGHFYLVEDKTDRALEIFKRVLDGNNWAAFGHIAAEAELHRAGINRDNK